MEKYKSPPDLFAAEKEIAALNYKKKYREKKRTKNELLSHQLNSISPDNRAWTIKNYFESDVASHKVFDIWLDDFENQTPHEVGDIKTKEPQSG